MSGKILVPVHFFAKSGGSNSPTDTVMPEIPTAVRLGNVLRKAEAQESKVAAGVPSEWPWTADAQVLHNELPIGQCRNPELMDACVTVYFGDAKRRQARAIAQSSWARTTRTRTAEFGADIS